MGSDGADVDVDAGEGESGRRRERRYPIWLRGILATLIRM